MAETAKQRADRVQAEARAAQEAKRVAALRPAPSSKPAPKAKERGLMDVVRDALAGKNAVTRALDGES